LGQGSFGDVLLVKNKKDDKLYALKRVSLDVDK
jgi:serine/threonine protein kinase